MPEIDVDPKRGERLKALRREAHVSQKAVAKAAGVSPSRVRAWENKGEGLGPTSLERLAAFYGVRAEWIETERGEKWINGDLAERLSGLETQVRAQGRALQGLAEAMSFDDAEGLLRDVGIAALRSEQSSGTTDDKRSPTANLDPDD